MKQMLPIILVFVMMIMLPQLMHLFIDDAGVAVLHYLLPLVAITTIAEHLSKGSTQKIIIFSLAAIFLFELSAILGLIIIPMIIFSKYLLCESLSYWLTHFFSMWTVYVLVSFLFKYRKQHQNIP